MKGYKFSLKSTISSDGIRGLTPYGTRGMGRKPRVQATPTPKKGRTKAK